MPRKKHKKRRRQFDTFLHHENPRIRAAVEELVADRKLFQEEWQQMEWEYESYDVVEEVLREIECELAAINFELTEAAEMDRSSGNYGHRGLTGCVANGCQSRTIVVHLGFLGETCI